MEPYITEWRFKFEPANLLRGTIYFEPSGCDAKYHVSWQTWIPDFKSQNPHAYGYYKDWMAMTTHDTYEEAVQAMKDQYEDKKRELL
jgi:hypothetical protein